MIKFMTHEVEQKVDELKAKANEEYKTERRRILEESTLKLEEEFCKRTKDLENKRVIEKSNLIRKSKMVLLKEKEKIVNEVFDKVSDRLKRIRINESYFSEDNKMDLIYCLDKDVSFVRRFFNDKEIRLLDEFFLGGIVTSSKDNTVIKDDSFLMRLNVAKEKYMKFISEYLFKKVYH
ncbi:vacuolar ATP synthase subunit E [Tubulinosema ratisbonensis]|uniref:Vacuolar ATP synthase subunit E n=1 Tax=Tubulinosema ratisbonensis TaxID=291195 RepID=A0A437APY9_9MICR|nr:vacuolar ATP synthase subunit E [Tubulinosema ratisbonensis]